MILNVHVLNFVVSALMTQKLIRLLIPFVTIMVSSPVLMVTLLVFQLPWRLVLPLNRNKNLFLKLPMSALNKEICMKLTPAQITQLVLDVLTAIGMALLAVFK